MASGFVWRIGAVALVLGMLAGVLTVTVGAKTPMSFAEIPSDAG